MRCLIPLVLFISCAPELSAQKRYIDFDIAKAQPISIEWSTSLSSDFSFAKTWRYAEMGIMHRDKWGQIKCDGICPDGIYKKIDKDGRIYINRLKEYYRLLDTSHVFHSFVYNEVGSDYWDTGLINIYKVHGDTIFSGAFYKGLYDHFSLLFIKDKCIAWLLFDRNYKPRGGHNYWYTTKGTMKIDKNLWVNGIIKAEFYLEFAESGYPDNPIKLQGMIYKKVKEKRK